MELQSSKIKNFYEGPSTSKKFNETIDSIHKDLAKLFDKSNENEDLISGNMDLVMRENHFLQATVFELQQALQNLEVKNKENRNGSSIEKRLRSFYNVANILDGDPQKQAFLDLNYGVISPYPTSIDSKLSYVTENGRVILPKGLEVFVKESNNTLPLDEATKEIVYTDLDTNGLTNAVDRNKNTFWVRHASFKESDCVTEVYGELHIKLPVAGLNNMYSNILSLSPYPEGSMRIKDIFYKGYGDQWDRLPNYPTKLVNGVEVPVQIENLKKTLFSFPRIEITELRIFYTQPYWFENEGRREFTYGFQDIDLEYRIFTEKETEFITKVDISDEARSFRSIKKPRSIPLLCSEHNLVDLVDHKLYYDEDCITEFEFGSTILAPLQTVYIKTSLKKQGDKIPFLKQMEFEYEHKGLGEI